MLGQDDEAAAIFRWLAQTVSPDAYVNVMAQYRPEDKWQPARYEDINRRPSRPELAAAMAAARRSGRWRFDSGSSPGDDTPGAE